MSKKVVPFRQTQTQKRPRTMKQLMDQQMDPANIVNHINMLLLMLEKQGVAVTDFDDHDRKLYRLKHFRGSYYYLAEKQEHTDT